MAKIKNSSVIIHCNKRFDIRCIIYVYTICILCVYKYCAMNTLVVFSKTHFVIIIIWNEYRGWKTNNGDELEKNLPCLPILVYNI